MTWLGLDLDPTTWAGLWIAAAAVALYVPQAIADMCEGRRARAARRPR